MATTQARRPPMIESDEATAEQLDMARRQGKALENALAHMTQKEAQGEEVAAGDYLVGYAVEHAEGMWIREGGELVWREPTQENAHFEVSVRDGADGRFVPGLDVHLTVVDEDGNEIGCHRQPFLWHPWLFHYGRNWQLPGDGTYTLRIEIDPPHFARHDHRNGCRYADPVEVEFTGVEVKTGQKLAEQQ